MKQIIKIIRNLSSIFQMQILKFKLKKENQWRTIAPFRHVNIWVSPDNKIEKAIFTEGDGYDYSNFSLINAVVKPGFVCFDIGANIGVYSTVFSYLTGDSAFVHSFEPVNHIRSRLKANLKLNGFGSVTVNDFALGDKTETIEMYQVKEGIFRAGTSSFVKNENVVSMGVDKFTKCLVQVKLLDQYAQEVNITKIDFIKIDVEGFEWNVLNGGRETISKFRPYVLIEYDEIRHAPQSKEFFEFFDTLQYKVYEFYIVAGAPVLRPFDFSHNPVHRNILCVP